MASTRTLPHRLAEKSAWTAACMHRGSLQRGLSGSGLYLSLAATYQTITRPLPRPSLGHAAWAKLLLPRTWVLLLCVVLILHQRYNFYVAFCPFPPWLLGPGFYGTRACKIMELVSLRLRPIDRRKPQRSCSITIGILWYCCKPYCYK